jgi:predicted nucleotidyltransferase
MKSLESIGYHPLAPVSAVDFADKDKRKSWITEKGMLVFQMRSSDPKGTDLDLFVEEPFSFADEYARAVWEDIAGVRVPVICYEELLRLKRNSGRATDLGDIEQLELLKNPPNE